jgi:hypothetical protein
MEFNLSIRKQNGISLGLSRAAFAKVMMAYINHGKTSSAKRNSGRKPKLSERVRRELKSIEYKNHRTAASSRTRISILEAPLSTRTVRGEFYKSNVHGKAAITKPLITENDAKRRKGWCDDHKTWTSDDRKYVIWSDDRPSCCSKHQAGFMFANRPRKLIILNAWFQV